MSVKRVRLRQARRAAGLTQEKLARALRVNEATVRRWEQAACTPSTYLLPALARQLGIPSATLNEMLEEGKTTGPAVSTPAPPPVVVWANPGAPPMSMAVIEGAWASGAGTEEDMRRRTLFGAAASGILAGGALIGLDPIRRLDEALGAPITNHDALEWERAADQYARLVNYQPAHELLPSVLADFEDAGRQFNAAPEDLRPRLARSCALLAGVTAISLTGIGRWTDADRFWRIADRAARHSEEPTVASLLAGRRAVLAMYTPAGSPAHVLDLADTALGWADGRACAGAASALSARAQILAMVGDRSGAVHALHQQETLYSKLDDTTTGNPQSVWSWPEARLWHTRSFAYSHLGDLPGATVAQDTALATYLSTQAKGQSPGLQAAKVRLHQAMSTIASGDPAAGARHVVTVIESIDPSHRGGTMRATAVMALSKVPDLAARNPEVRQAREALALTTGT